MVRLTSHVSGCWLLTRAALKYPLLWAGSSGQPGDLAPARQASAQVLICTAPHPFPTGTPPQSTHMDTLLMAAPCAG